MQNNLGEMLAVRGLTVSEFARMTGIPQPTLHRIVNGRGDLEGIKAGTFVRIAHGLGITADALYFGDSSFDAGKVEIDRVYASTCGEGRAAMVANARGVAQAYPPFDSTLLPTIRDDMAALLGC